jgi:transglutaminase-like putative cysteine protease
MKITIEHELRYRYDTPVRMCTQYLRVVPSDTARQRVIAWTLEAPGAPTRTLDGYGNVLDVLTLDTPVNEVVIRAAGVLETRRHNDRPSDFSGHPLPPQVFLRSTDLTRADASIAEFAAPFAARARSRAGLRALASALRRRMPFVPGQSQYAASATEAFASRAGAAEDQTHVFIACCRQLGVPARFVSGYLCEPGSTDAHDATHAWAEAWIENVWRSFDVAHDGPVDDYYVKVAMGADYLDACPVRGVRVGGEREVLSAATTVAVQGTDGAAGAR